MDYQAAEVQASEAKTRYGRAWQSEAPLPILALLARQAGVALMQARRCTPIVLTDTRLDLAREALSFFRRAEQHYTGER